MWVFVQYSIVVEYPLLNLNLGCGVKGRGRGKSFLYSQSPQLQGKMRKCIINSTLSFNVKHFTVSQVSLVEGGLDNKRVCWTYLTRDVLLNGKWLWWLCGGISLTSLGAFWCRPDALIMDFRWSVKLSWRTLTVLLWVCPEPSLPDQLAVHTSGHDGSWMSFM